MRKGTVPAAPIERVHIRTKGYDGQGSFVRACHCRPFHQVCQFAPVETKNYCYLTQWKMYEEVWVLAHVWRIQPHKLWNRNWNERWGGNLSLDINICIIQPKRREKWQVIKREGIVHVEYPKQLKLSKEKKNNVYDLTVFSIGNHWLY